MSAAHIASLIICGIALLPMFFVTMWGLEYREKYGSFLAALGIPGCAWLLGSCLMEATGITLLVHG